MGILTPNPGCGTLCGTRRLAYADSRMRNFLLTLLHLAVTTAKLCGPGGVRAVIAENLLLKQQLIVLRRGRPGAPTLTLSDRLMCGFESLLLSLGRIRKVAIVLRLSTLWRFIGRWSVANTAGCSPQRRAQKSPDRRGRVRHSSRPSSSSSRAILGSAVRALRASSRRRSGSTSTRTSCTARWRNTIAPLRSEPGPRGCRSSATPPTASGAWTSFGASRSRFGACRCGKLVTQPGHTRESHHRGDRDGGHEPLPIPSPPSPADASGRAA
jgi:hypothetical protein